MHHAGCVLEGVVPLKNQSKKSRQKTKSGKLWDLELLHLFGEAEDIKGFVGILHILLVVYPVNGKLALGHVPVVLDVVCQKALLLKQANT